MAKSPPLKVIRHISLDEGKTYKLWDECTEEERKTASNGVAKALVRHLQERIDRDPELWAKLCYIAKTEHPEWIPDNN